MTVPATTSALTATALGGSSELTPATALGALLVGATTYYGYETIIGALGKLLLGNTTLSEGNEDFAGEVAPSEQKLLEQKSTGRTAPNDLKEKLAMEEAMSNPRGRHAKGVEMKDPRYPAKNGWIKLAQEVNGTNIHYIKDTKTGAVADFKFK